MKIEEIDDVICDILMNDGPDGHVDGHEAITRFIDALLNGKGYDWSIKYREEKGI